MKQAGRVIAWVLAGLVALVVVAGGVGLILPESHSATVQRTVAGTPEEVWALIADVEAFPMWRADVESVEILPPIDGLPVWRELGPSGTITFEVTRRDPPARLVARIADPDLPFGGVWTYELERTGAGTLVTIREDGLIYNPIYRVVSRFFLGYEATMITYLDALETRVGP